MLKVGDKVVFDSQKELDEYIEKDRPQQTNRSLKEETEWLKRQLFDDQELHETEIRCPEQCAEFRKILGNLYQVHLEKNADYSPYNMLATGEIGVITRLWDKMARLMNLIGFDIATGKYSGRKDAKNESIEDTYLDLCNYGIIATLMSRGVWGK